MRVLSFNLIVFRAAESELHLSSTAGGDAKKPKMGPGPFLYSARAEETLSTKQVRSPVVEHS